MTTLHGMIISGLMATIVYRLSNDPLFRRWLAARTEPVRVRVRAAVLVLAAVDWDMVNLVLITLILVALNGWWIGVR